MIRMTAGGERRGGLATLSIAIEIQEQLHRLTFSDAHWNTILRSGLQGTGESFITVDLPKRFTDYAETHLGHPGKKSPGFMNDRELLRAGMATGKVDRIARLRWNGWNPWRDTPVPGALWQRFLEEERQHGRFKRSVTGYFSGARAGLRAKVKADIRGELRAAADDGTIESLPLVHTGELRDTAVSESQATARATASMQSLKISIPSPHATAPMVGAVITRITQDELGRMGQVLTQDVDAMINGAAVRVVKRGKHLGQVRRRLTDDQRQAISAGANQRPAIAAEARSNRFAQFRQRKAVA